MDLRLGKRADYAIRAVLALARADREERVKARAIAEEMDVPTSFIPHVLADLARAGLVDSDPGPTGGYRLNRPADRISLLDVVEAVEGEPTLSECVLRGGPCRWEGRCAVHEYWAAAKDAMRDQLAATTFADVVATDRDLEAAEQERGRAS
jgi:Rrf2 family protein